MLNKKGVVPGAGTGTMSRLEVPKATERLSAHRVDDTGGTCPSLVQPCRKTASADVDEAVRRERRCRLKS